jgi:hypothetical protein
MRKLPIEARWRNGHRQIVRLSIPNRPFSAAVDAAGSHLAVTLTRLEAEQVRASLTDVLRISEGNE